MNTKILFFMFLCISFMISNLRAQNYAIDYAIVDASKQEQTFIPINVNNTNINVLSTNNAKISSELKHDIRNYIFFCVKTDNPGVHKITWKVNSLESGRYSVNILTLGKALLQLQCNGSSNDKIEQPIKGWNRISLGEITLKKGINELTIIANSEGPFSVSTLEVTETKLLEEMNLRALSQRVKVDWLSDAAYGLMFQWTNRATPINSKNVKSWNEKVNDFDLNKFFEIVDRSGAEYVLWSITWGGQYISAPLKSLDEIILGRTTQRDLLGEIADGLHKRNKRLIFYYHYGYDCNHSKDPDWMKASGGYKADKSQLLKNIMNILSEIGNRYKDKLDGWWFDGAQRYYNTHFDGTTGGITTFPFEQLTKVAREGNPQRIIAYNSWILPPLTEFQDFYAGEGYHALNVDNNGIIQDGIYRGLAGHSCFPLEKGWGRYGTDKPIQSPMISTQELIKRIQMAKQKGYPLSINLLMYEDGSVSPESLAQMEEVRKIIRGK